MNHFSIWNLYSSIIIIIIIILLPSIAIVQGQSHFVVLGAQNFVPHLQALESISIALNDTSSALVIYPIFLSNDSFASLQEIESYLVANSSTALAVFILDGLIGDDTITSMLQTYNVRLYVR